MGALDFDPDTVLSQVRTKLPEASLDLFFVQGGDGGAVQYSVRRHFSPGGQLVVTSVPMAPCNR